MIRLYITAEKDFYNALRCKRLTMLNPKLKLGVANTPKYSAL
jgi:hypothetical protein